MKATVDAADLVRVTADAARVIEPKALIPALAAAVITVRGGESGTLSVEGESDVAAVHSACEVTTGEPGRIGVPGRHLAAVAATLAGEVTLTASSDSGLTLTAGHKRFGLPSMDLSDRPQPPQLPTATVEVDGTALQRAVAGASSAARDAQVSYFGDARLDAADGFLAVWGGSGARVSRHVLAETGSGEPGTGIAHVNLRHLTDALRGADGTVHLGFGDRWLSVVVGRRTTGVRVTDHAAPGNNLAKIDTVVAAATRKPVLATLTLDREDALAVATEALAVGADRVALLPFADRIEYTAVNEGGDVSGEIPAIGDTEAEGLVVGLRPHYLSDAVRSVLGDVLTLRFRQPPNLIDVEGSDGGTYFLGSIKIDMGA